MLCFEVYFLLVYWSLQSASMAGLGLNYTLFLAKLSWQALNMNSYSLTYQDYVIAQVS